MDGFHLDFFFFFFVTAFSLKNDSYNNYLYYGSESLILKDCLYAVVVSAVVLEVYIFAVDKIKGCTVSVQRIIVNSCLGR